MIYYSELSRSQVTETEAIKQIIDVCDRWYKMTRRKIPFDRYIKNHPELLDIGHWSCFEKIKQ